MATILLVDDEPAMRRLVEITLNSPGRFRFLHAANGEEALRLARSEPVDLVLLDVAMPGIDGFAVCQALNRLPADHRPRVFMLTARNTEADRAHGRACGAAKYFTKPFSPLALLESVERSLGSTA